MYPSDPRSFVDMYPPTQAQFGGACAGPFYWGAFNVPRGPWANVGGGYYPGYYNSCYEPGCNGGMFNNRNPMGPCMNQPQMMYGPALARAQLSQAMREQGVTVGETYEAVVVNGEAHASPYAEGRGLLLDVRTPHEFSMGSVPGAYNVPVCQLSNLRDALIQATGGDPEYPISIFCELGVRAECARELLTDMGFRRVSNIGGMRAGPLQEALRTAAQGGQR